MKNCTVNYKNEITKMGKQQKVDITYNINQHIPQEDINQVSRYYDGNILKSMMKVVELDVNNPLAVGTGFNLKYGLYIENDEDYEMLDLGNYYVFSIEEKKDTKSYLLKCYDLMYITMIMYDDLNLQLDFTNGVTIKQFLIAIATTLGLNNNLNSITFANQNRVIYSNLYSGLGYTVRDVLDEISEVTGGSIYINSNELLTIGYPTENSQFTIDENYMKDADVNINEKYGVVNAVVLSRSAESDNVYIRDEQSILENGLCEIKIVDNQIMNNNDRADYLPEIFSKLDGLTYYTNDYASTGITFLDYLDRYTIKVDNNYYNCIMLNDEINITKGLEELVYAEKIEQGQTDYTKADKTDQRINQTYLIVDKQNQKIESVINNVTEQNNKISQITQTVDELNSKISDIADITVTAESNYAMVSLSDINESEPITIRIHPIGNQHISYLYPRNNLYPSNNLYMTDRRLRFTNLIEYILTEDSKYTNYKRYYSYDGTDYTLLVAGTDYTVGASISGTIYENKYVDYILPMDLLYYDANNYDEFLLDYDSETCQIRKKVTYNADGTTALLPAETTYTFTYPHINLDDGNYEIELLGYNTGYLYIRMMASNIYTSQFATKSEMNSAINQKADEISLEVDQTLESYPTTTEMNSAISVKANEINSEVRKKVGEDEVISKINQSSEAVLILANKLGLTANDIINLIAGNSINLTSKNISINSNNFTVDASGNMSCTNANVNGNVTSDNAIITGGKVKVKGGYTATDLLRIESTEYSEDYRKNFTYIQPVGAGIVGNGGRIDIGAKSEINSDSSIILEGNSYTEVYSSYVKTPQVIQTSLESEKKNFEKYGSALNKLNDIDIYKYNLKFEKDTDKKHIGFVIGDKYKYLQELTNNENNAVDIYSLASFTLQICKEQQAIIENLQNEINKLKEGK